MPQDATSTMHPVVYAGRLPVSRAARAVVLDDEAVPAAVAGAVSAATLLVVLDPLSFPVGALGDGWRDLPTVVNVPDHPAQDELVAVLDGPLLSHLGPYDRYVVTHPATWEALRRRYGLARHQRLDVDPTDIDGLVDATMRSIGLDDHQAQIGKGTHQVQAPAVRAQVAAALVAQPVTRPFSALVVGAVTGRWVPYVLPHGQVTVVEGDDASRAAFGARYPEVTVHGVESHLRLPVGPDAADLVICADALGDRPVHEQRRLLAEAWRAVRPAGRLVVLERFVGDPRSHDLRTRPRGVSAFMETVVEATGRGVTLEHVEALRYPHEDWYAGGLIAFVKVGVPATW